METLHFHKERRKQIRNYIEIFLVCVLIFLSFYTWFIFGSTIMFVIVIIFLCMIPCMCSCLHIPQHVYELYYNEKAPPFLFFEGRDFQ